MKFTKHIGVWLAALVICYLITPMFISQGAIMGRAQAEISMVSERFDINTARSVTHDAEMMYTAVFIDSGAMAAANKGFVDQRMRREAEEAILGGPANLSGLTNGYLGSLFANTYSAFVRLAIIFSWLPYLLPFIMAAFVDGAISRKIKLETFRMISPVTYSLGMHMMIVLTFFPLIYLVTPVPVTPMFMPVWAILFSLPSMLVLSNTMRVS